MSLGGALCEMKGEFFKGERIYRMELKDLHEKLFKTKQNNLL